MSSRGWVQYAVKMNYFTSVWATDILDEASVLDCVEASTNPQQGPWASEGFQPQQSCVGVAAERVAPFTSEFGRRTACLKAFWMHWC